MKSSQSTTIACLSLILSLSNINLMIAANTAVAQSTITQKSQIDYKTQALAILPQIITAANQIEEGNYQKQDLLINVLRLYVAAGEYDKIDPLVNSVKDKDIKSYLWQMLVLEYAENEQFERAITIANRLPNPEDKSNAFSGITEQYLLRDKYSEVLKISRNISSEKNRIYILLNLVDKYTSSGQKKAALDVLFEILSLTQSIKSNENSEQEYLLARIIFEYERIGQTDSHFQVPANLSDRVLHNLVGMYTRDQKYDKAISITHQIKTEEQKTSAWLDIVSYLVVFEEKYEQALELIKQIDSPYGKVHSLLNIAETALSFEKKDQVLVVMPQLQQAISTLPVNSNNAGVLTRTARLYSQLGQKTAALELTAKSESIIEQIEEPNAKIYHVLNVAEQYRKIGDKNKSINLLAQAEKLVSTTKLEEGDLYSKNQWLISIASEYAKNHEYERVIQLGKSLEEEEDRSQVLSEIAFNYARDGEYNQAVKIIETIPDELVKQSASNYAANTYIYTYLDAGDIDGAVAAANQMTESDIKNQAFTAIVYHYIQQKQYDPNRALAIVNTIPDTEIRLNTLAYIISEYIYREEYDKALKLIDDITSPLNKITMLIDLAQVYNQNEQYNSALQLLDTIKITNNLVDTTQLARILTRLSIAYGDAKQKSKSGEILNQALSAANTIPNTEDRVLALIPIAEQFITLSK